jgi:tRNA threonylcarbamoyladenosine biosynthesis protein TsaE
MKKVVHIKHLHDLETFAEHFSLSLHGGDIVGLVGDLGSGKTTFIQHLAKAFGVKKPVRSPTFILMQVFKTGATAAKKTGIKQLCHIDAYRLEDEDELFALGFEDYASRRDTVVLIEWVDRVPSVQWLDHYREVKFEFNGDGERILTLDKPLASAAD